MADRRCVDGDDGYQDKEIKDDVNDGVGDAQRGAVGAETAGQDAIEDIGDGASEEQDAKPWFGSGCANRGNCDDRPKEEPDDDQ